LALPHVIVSQQNLIETDSLQLAKDIQQKFHEVINSALFLDDLEALFSEIAGDKNWVSLDKLELDLGNLSPNISIEDLKKCLLREMSKSISATDVNKVVETKSSGVLKSNTKTKVEKTTLISKLEKAWFAFISYQTLPENFHFKVRSLRHLISISEEILEKEKTTFTSWFIQLTLNINRAKLASLPLSFFSEILFKSGIFSKKELSNFSQLIKSFKKEGQRQEVKETLIDFLRSEIVNSKETRRIATHDELVKTKRLFQKLDELASAIRQKTITQKDKSEPHLEQKKETEKLVEEKLQEGLEKEDEKKNPFITNAGMSLLFPFLPEVFKQLKFSKNNKLTQPDRALHFLGFVERGEEQFAPHQNLIYKIVCGLPENHFTSGEIFLSKKEKDEANKLLTSVIEHWGVLKNTTPNGLRNAFLIREGKLVNKGFDYHLKVEQKTQDVLLSKIPWGFGVIRLPWMTNFLHVDW